MKIIILDEIIDPFLNPSKLFPSARVVKRRSPYRAGQLSLLFDKK